MKPDISKSECDAKENAHHQRRTKQEFVYGMSAVEANRAKSDERFEIFWRYVCLDAHVTAAIAYELMSLERGMVHGVLA